MFYLRLALMGATLGASAAAGDYLFNNAVAIATSAGKSTARMRIALREKKAALKAKFAKKPKAKKAKK